MRVTTTPRGVSWDIVDQALAAGGWACFVPAAQLDAVKTKAGKIARRLGIQIATTYVEGRFVALPAITGRCTDPKPKAIKSREDRDLEIVHELQLTVRRLALDLARDGVPVGVTS